MRRWRRPAPTAPESSSCNLRVRPPPCRRPAAMVRGGICARLSAPVSYEQPMTITRDFALDAKYRREEGLIFLSGIQALVRLPLDQRRADRRRGLNTATLISGYRGSPLGGLDLTPERNPDLLREHNVGFISGLHEGPGAAPIHGRQPP